MSSFFDFDFTSEAEDVSFNPTFESDTLILGTPNDPPVISDLPQSNGDWWSGIKNVLGSVGTIARDVGTAVGNAERARTAASQQYQTARTNARNDNKIMQWWQYSSTQDKVMAGLALVGVAVAIYTVVKK